MTVLVSDSFNRANDATTMGSTDSYNGGSSLTWTPKSGVVAGVYNNAAYFVSGTNPFYTTVDPGVSDVSITVTIPLYADQFVCAFRVNPANNTGLMFNSTGRKLQSFNGSAYTTIASTTGNLANGATIKVTAQGSTINVYENGTLIITATSTINQTITNHGLWNWRVSGSTALNGSWDNFQIESIGATGTVGSTAYATKQIINQTSSATYATKQAISLSGSAVYATKQTIYQVGSVSYATQQTITDGGTAGSIAYGTKQILYQTASVQVATKQRLYTVSSSEWATKQIFGVSIARAISLFGSLPSPIALLGEEAASVHLLGSFTDTIALQGSKPSIIALEGGLMATKTDQNFTMYAGDTPPFTFTMADSTSLSGATVKWVMRRGNVKGAQVLLKTTSSGLSVSGTVATITLLSADTVSLEGKFYHEAEVTDISGVVSTVMTGIITILPSGA